jgi:hypothetical protein
MGGEIVGFCTLLLPFMEKGEKSKDFENNGNNMPLI